MGILQKSDSSDIKRVPIGNINLSIIIYYISNIIIWSLICEIYFGYKNHSRTLRLLNQCKLHFTFSFLFYLLTFLIEPCTITISSRFCLLYQGNIIIYWWWGLLTVDDFELVYRKRSMFT